MIHVLVIIYAICAIGVLRDKLILPSEVSVVLVAPIHDNVVVADFIEDHFVFGLFLFMLESILLIKISILFKSNFLINTIR